MAHKLWAILGVIFLIIAIFFVNKYVSSLMEEKFVEECFAESIDQYSLALAELDESLCINLTDEAVCHDQVMLIKSRFFLNASYCDELQNEAITPLCKLTVKENNIEVCTNLEGNEKLFCLAMFGGELDRCNDLPDFDGSIEECKLFYYLSDAFYSGNDAPCYELDGEYSYICKSVVNSDYDFKEEVKEDYCRREYLVQTGRI